MDVRKLRGALLRVHYNFLRLIAGIEDVLEAYQKVGVIRRLKEPITHLPPPVITDRTALLDATTHMLCCSCGMYFSAAASTENDQGSMNLASNTAPVASTRPSSSR